MAVRISSANSTYQANLNRPQGAWSVCTWFKISTDRNTYSSVFSLDPGEFGEGGDFITVQTSNDGTTLEAYPTGSGGTMSLSLTVGTWYYLGISGSGVNYTARLRAQGAGSFTNATGTITAAPTQTRLLIGNSTFDETAEYFNGCVASFRVWSGVALSAAELEAEYPYASPLRTAGLTAFYRFDTASTVDNSGNGFTLSGGSGATTEAGPTGLIEPGGGGPIIHGWGAVPIF